MLPSKSCMMSYTYRVLTALRLLLLLVLDQVLLTSKKWRLHSGCNHSAAYVDQWKGYESSELLTESLHAALRAGNAHQDLKKSEEIC